jgi:hypothetical protein
MTPTPRYPSNPALWQQCRARWRDTSAGTPRGQWSSLKCALAVLDYERAGGKWSTDKVE